MARKEGLSGGIVGAFSLWRAQSYLVSGMAKSGGWHTIYSLKKVRYVSWQGQQAGLCEKITN